MATKNDYWHSKEYLHDYYIKNKERLQEYKRRQYQLDKSDGLYLRKNNEAIKKEGKIYGGKVDKELAEKFDKVLKEKDLKYTTWLREQIKKFIEEN